MALPKRKPSFTAPLKMSLHQMLIEASKIEYTALSSSELPSDCVGGCTEAFNTIRKDSSLYLSADELISSSEFTLACLDEAENEEEEEKEERGVRFAPSPSTITVLGLDDYTPEEVEACWYSRRDVDNFRRLDYISNSRKALSFPLSRREDKRWNT